MTTACKVWEFEFRTHVEPKIDTGTAPATVTVPGAVLARSGAAAAGVLSCQVGDRCVITGPDGTWVGVIYDTAEFHAYTSEFHAYVELG